MKLALHRSLIFWFGLLMMAFICWAWRDSWRLETGFTHGRSHLGSGYGRLVISHDPASAPERFFYRGPLGKPEMKGSLNGQLPSLLGGTGSPISYQEFEAIRDPADLSSYAVGLLSTEGWLLDLPYPFLLVLVLLTWTALLVWRARRRNQTFTT